MRWYVVGASDDGIRWDCGMDTLWSVLDRYQVIPYYLLGTNAVHAPFSLRYLHARNGIHTKIFMIQRPLVCDDNGLLL